MRGIVAPNIFVRRQLFSLTTLILHTILTWAVGAIYAAATQTDGL
jgi:hypothetical protein